ncbi:MAG: PAS domain S-box protein [Alphaproteobacteria bacterium]
MLDLIDRHFDANSVAIARIVALAHELESREPVTESFVFQVPGRGNAGPPQPAGITAQCRAMALEDGRAGVLMVAQSAHSSAEDPNARTTLFETIADEIPVAIAVFDRHGSLLYRNAACHDLLDDGPGTTALLAQWLGDKNGLGDKNDGPSEKSSAHALIQQTLSFGSANISLTMHTRFGERIQRITTACISVPAQGRLGLLMCFQDIEDRRRYETGLVARLDKLEASLENLADFTFELDENLQLAGSSPKFAEHFNLAGNTLTGRYWAEIADEAGFDAAGDILAELTAGNPVRSQIILGAGPAERAILLSFSPMISADELFIGFTCTGLVLTPQSRPSVVEAYSDAPTAPSPDADKARKADNDAKAPAGENGGNPDQKPEKSDLGGDDAEAFSAIARALASRPGGATAPAARPRDPDEATNQSAAALRVVGGLESIPAPKAPAKPGTTAKPGATAEPGEPGAATPIIEDAERLEKLSEPVLVHRNFDIVFANQAMHQMFGNTAKETVIADNNLLNLFPDERARLFSLQSKFDDGQMPDQPELLNLRLRARAPDRSTVAIVANIAPVMFEGEACVRMIFESAAAKAEPAADPIAPAPIKQPNPVSQKIAATQEVPAEQAAAAVTLPRPERARAEEEVDRELRESRARENELRAVINSAADGIATLDHQGQIVTLNASAEAIFGVNAVDVVGHPLSGFFEDGGAKTVDAYIQSLGQDNASSLYSEGCEVTGRRKDGGTVPLFVTIGRMKVDGPPRFCVVVRDITQWKSAQEALRSEKEAAEEASDRKSDFLAKVSHELRTPLNAIIGFSEVMSEEKFGPIANDRYKGYLADIHTSGGHLLSLINELLDLSKIESGKLELDFTSVDVAKIVSQAVSLLEPQAARERVIIRTSLPDALPPVVADDRSIRQIVLNLVSNAIKFTPPGGQVILSVLVDETGQLQIRVRDTGVGMSEQELTDAMVPFTQISNGEHTDLAGTGLGLPLTRALTEANRAEFKIESTPSAGTLVQVIFPTNRVLAS